MAIYDFPTENKNQSTVCVCLLFGENVHKSIEIASYLDGFYWLEHWTLLENICSNDVSLVM